MTNDGAGDDRGSRAARFDERRTAAILALAYSCSLLDRMVMSLLIEPIKSDLKLDDVQVSLLAGTAFSLCYMLFSFVFGTLADRYSRKIIIIVGIVLWSAATLACGFATSFAMLFLARMAVGVGEGSLSPSAYSMLGDKVPPQRRGIAMSIFATGGTFGGGIAILFGGFLLGWATTMLSSAGLSSAGTQALRAWQLVFMIVGIPGLLVAILIALFIREPARLAATLAKSSWSELLVQFRHHKPAYLLIFCGYATLAIAGFGFQIWGPSAFVRVHHLLPYQTGLLFGLGFAVGGTIGVFLGGALADRIGRKRLLDASFRVAIGSALVQAPLFLVAYLSQSVTVAAIAMCLAIAAAAMIGGLQAVMIQLLVPGRLRGKATAVYTSMVNLIGMGVAPTLVALLSKLLNAGDSSISYALAIMSGVTLLIGAALIYLGLPHARALVESTRSAPDQS